MSVDPNDFQPNGEPKIELPPMPPRGPSMTDTALARRVLVALSAAVAVVVWIIYAEADATRTVGVPIQGRGFGGDQTEWVQVPNVEPLWHACAATGAFAAVTVACFLWSIRDALHRLAGPAVQKPAP